MCNVLQKSKKDTERYMEIRRAGTEKSQKIYHVLLGILLVCVLAMMLLLSYWACRYSYYGAVDFGSRGLLVKDSTWLHIALFLAAALCTVGIDKLLNRYDRILQEKVCLCILTVTCVIAFFLGVFYVVKNPYYPIGDQISTTAFAAYCREGNFSMLCSGGYVGMYQQQKGLGILYEILFALFGNFNYVPAKILHVVWWMLTILAGYGFLKLNTDRAVFRVLYCPMMLGCFPFLLYLPYIYGDVLSISFGMILFYAVAAYEHFGQKRYIALGAFAAGLAVLARKNTWVVLIAVAIYALLTSLKKQKLQYLLAGLAILLTAALSVKAVDVIYEVRSGYPSGVGIPSILWVSMGLQETEGRAGVYNRYQQTTFEEYDFQQKPAAQQGKEDIRERLGEFARDPGMAFRFFKNKLEGQWIEPMYAALETTESFEDDAELTSVLANLYYGTLGRIVWNLSNYYQSILYLAGLMALVMLGILWWKKKDVPTAMWLPWIATFGGFLFSILWEAKSRYVFPYCVFMILYAPEGLYQMGLLLLKLPKLRKLRKNASGQDKGEEAPLREIA